MKKTLVFLSVLLCHLLTGTAQERIYVVTDRNAYLSGDLVWCSLFVVGENDRQSHFGAVSYLELISADGTVAEAKVGLLDGRGAGCFRIPAQAPTGYYRLLAYTADSQPDREGSRLVAVFNTRSSARVTDGVALVPETAYRAPALPEDCTTGGIGLSLPARLPQDRDATLLLSAPPQGADVAVSVYHEDALVPVPQNSLAAFLEGQPVLPGRRSGEYEGEIIQAHVEGLRQEAKGDDEITAFLSAAGDPSNVYIGRSDADGQILFFTDNIYGNRELVCEVVSMQGQSCHISLTSPFTHPEAGEMPVLTLSPARRDALVARKAALQAQQALPLDTLARFLPKREGQLFSGSPRIRYHLDDYKRFPTIREICVEFVRELQFSRVDGRWRIRLNTADATSSHRYVLDNILVLLDGVVITDHGMLESFDAMLLEDIDIYPQPVAMGGITYNGVVNFITKRNYVTALQFPQNVRVVDFMGVSYPAAYPGGLPEGTEKDLREVLYWHPALELPGGSQTRIRLHTPSRPGTYRVVVEGWTTDGLPVFAGYSFVVE